jgi:putative transposase
MLRLVVTGWLERREREAIAYLIEETASCAGSWVGGGSVPYHAPNANAYAERFVRSINGEYLDRLIPIGERHFRRTVTDYVAHYHQERNHQGIANALIAGAPATSTVGRIRRHSRLGGVLNYYERTA